MIESECERDGGGGRDGRKRDLPTYCNSCMRVRGGREMEGKRDLPAYSNRCIYTLENSSAELWTEMDIQFKNGE